MRNLINTMDKERCWTNENSHCRLKPPCRFTNEMFLKHENEWTGKLILFHKNEASSRTVPIRLSQDNLKSNNTSAKMETEPLSASHSPSLGNETEGRVNRQIVGQITERMKEWMDEVANEVVNDLMMESTRVTRNRMVMEKSRSS